MGTSTTCLATTTKELRRKQRLRNVENLRTQSRRHFGRRRRGVGWEGCVFHNDIRSKEDRMRGQTQKNLGQEVCSPEGWWWRGRGRRSVFPWKFVKGPIKCQKLLITFWKVKHCKGGRRGGSSTVSGPKQKQQHKQKKSSSKNSGSNKPPQEHKQQEKQQQAAESGAAQTAQTTTQKQ